jgi:hypothetical protein
MSALVNPSRQLSTAELLDAVPQPNRAVQSEGERGGELVLSVPLRQRWYMRRPLSLVFPFSTQRRVALDGLGIEVWRGCDGRRTAEQIVEQFARDHGLTFHESRLSVMQFLRELTRRGLIVMVGKSQEQAA